MFSPTRNQVRRFFFDAWRKYGKGVALEGLERPAVEIVLMHPEYQPLLATEESLAQEFPPDGGRLNPFLHLSLHLALSEQLSIDQPRGIRDLHAGLLATRDAHEALHVLLECLGETVWQAQRTGRPPDEAAYLACIRKGLG
jgi:hypothetical protein